MVADLDVDQFSFGRFFKFAGPGMLVSIAYLDPGNCMNLSLKTKPIRCGKESQSGVTIRCVSLL